MCCERGDTSKVSMGEPNKLQAGAARAGSARAGRGVQSTKAWWSCCNRFNVGGQAAAKREHDALNALLGRVVNFGHFQRVF